MTREPQTTINHMSETKITSIPRSVSVPPHSADGMTIDVECEDGARMTIIDPRSFVEGGPEWVSRYGNIESIRYALASLLDSYDYLLSGNINQKEAIRRLRLARAARKECCVDA